MYLLYFDPGIAALMIQALVAAAAAVLLFSKSVLQQVKSFLGLAKEDDDPYRSIDIEFEETDADEARE